MRDALSLLSVGFDSCSGRDPRPWPALVTPRRCPLHENTTKSITSLRRPLHLYPTLHPRASLCTRLFASLFFSYVSIYGRKCSMNKNYRCVEHSGLSLTITISLARHVVIFPTPLSFYIPFCLHSHIFIISHMHALATLLWEHSSSKLYIRIFICCRSSRCSITNKAGFGLGTSHKLIPPCMSAIV